MFSHLNRVLSHEKYTKISNEPIHMKSLLPKFHDVIGSKGTPNKHFGKLKKINNFKRILRKSYLSRNSSTKTYV